MDGVPYAINDPRISGVFQQLANDPSPADAAVEDEGDWYFDVSINAFSRGNHDNSEGAKGGRAPKSSRGAGKERDNYKVKGPPAGAVPCSVCQGFHEDLRTCPNGLAKQDPTYKASTVATCGHWVNGHKCDGQGHFAKHHRQQWTAENPGKPVPWSSRTPKGKGKGGGSRYNGKGVTKRIVVLADGSVLVDDDIDQAVYEEEDDQDGEVANGGEPQVSASTAQGVSPNEFDNKSPSPPSAPETTLQASGLTAGQQRAAQWSASGVAGCTTSARYQQGTRLELESKLPSCSKLMRGEREGCLFSTMGVTESKALPSLAIPCDYYEWADGRKLQEPMEEPLVEVSMTEAELFGGLAPVAVSLGCVAIALPDTILARSDQLSDHEFGVFNNSSPHCSFSVSPPFDFLRNWTILGTEAGWLLGLVEQIYMFPLSNCLSLIHI